MLKERLIEHLGFKIKFGRLPPIHNAHKRFLNLSKYELALPQSPPTFDFTPKAPVSLKDVYENNLLGCCVIAGGYHVKGLLSGNAGKEKVYTNQQIVKDYSLIGGYVPGNSATDRGCVITDALHHWAVKGWQDGTKLSRWLAVDHTRPAFYKNVLWTFENLLYGCGLPDSWLNNVKPGFVWDADKMDPNNGHCFMAGGYNGRGTIVDTWGMLGTLTDAAHIKDIDEMYVLVDLDIINKASKKSPNGFNWSQLIADLRLV